MRRGKYVLLFILSVVIGNKTYCQIATCQPASSEDGDEDAIMTPSFQENVIRAKKISQITMSYFIKPDGDPISDEGIVQQYFFDTVGKITESISAVKVNDNVCDSTKCTYYYDADDNITIKRTQTGDFYDTWYYKWGKNRQLQTEAHVHETSAITADGDFKIATQRIISADSFAYIPYPKQLQQYEYNEDNKVFRETITQYDENKRVLSRNCHYTVGWLYSQVDFNYDESGRIIRYANSGNLKGNMSENTIIKYDSSGKVAEENVWEDGKQKQQIEYMYDNATGLISDKLDRESEKALISIIRFSYEMYDNAAYPTATK